MEDADPPETVLGLSDIGKSLGLEAITKAVTKLSE